MARGLEVVCASQTARSTPGWREDSVRRLHSSVFVSSVALIGILAGAACERGSSERVKDRADELVNDAERAASTAGQRAAEVAERASEKGAIVVRAADIKMTLMADRSIDASGIDVESDAGTSTITLNGTVPSEAERDTAGIVAAAQAPGYRVQNRLTVR